MVPSAASAGFVAPMTSRYFATAFFAFQNLDDHRARSHELDQLTKERTLGVDGLETLSLFLGHLDAALADDAQAGLLDDGVDGAGQVTLGRVGLDDGKKCAGQPWEGSCCAEIGVLAGL
jgi:hypothetical protein